jgi:hypothetical protein
MGNMEKYWKQFSMLDQRLARFLPTPLFPLKLKAYSVIVFTWKVTKYRLMTHWLFEET